MKKSCVRIGGMSCAACSASVEKALRKVEGVEDVTVNLATNRANISFDENLVDQEIIEKAIIDDGFFIDTGNNETAVADEKRIKIKLISAAILTSLLLYIAMGPMVGLPVPDYMDNPLYYAITQMILAIAMMCIGSKFYTRGYSNLFRRHPNMDSLVALGTTASFAYSLYSTYLIWGGDASAVHSLFYESTATIITLVMIGKYLEAGSKRKTGDAIRALISLAPDTADILRDGQEVSIDASDLEVGDIAVVRPGQRFPADGIINFGDCRIDESMLTGESMPVSKGKGESVFGGTINTDGLVHVEIDRIGFDTALSQIIMIMEDAQSSKAPIAKLADTIAGVFVPAVLVISVVVALLWAFTGKDLEFCMKVLVSVLVIACPCALGLATPLAVIMGTSKGAQYGILFKNAESIQLTESVDFVVFDKTGTLTEGKPVITDVVTNMEQTEFVRIAASAESGSSHPLATAIINGFDGPLYDISDFISYTGNGISAKINEMDVIIGNRELLSDSGVSVENYIEKAEKLESSGKTGVFISINGVCEGVIAIADTLRSSSSDAIHSLNSMGVRTMMISGDNSLVAENIASSIGITDVVSKAKPEDKISYISKLQDEGHTVMMVGDGINDGPALVKSNVGVSISSGTDVAIDSADVVIMNDDIGSIPKMMKIGGDTMRNIRQNLFLAFIYNVVCIPIAAGGLYIFGGPLLDPMICAAAMSVSSLSVTGNALRLGYKKY